MVDCKQLQLHGLAVELAERVETQLEKYLQAVIKKTQRIEAQNVFGRIMCICSTLVASQSIIYAREACVCACVSVRAALLGIIRSDRTSEGAGRLSLFNLYQLKQKNRKKVARKKVIPFC